jgi:hypothetical protein
MAVVRRTVLRWTNRHFCTGQSGSLGGIYPLKRIGTPQKITRLKVLNCVHP